MKPKRTRLESARCAFYLALAGVALGAGGCMVGPNYKPPSPALPAQYREPTTGPTTAPAGPAASIEPDVRWWRRFGDDRLASLVERAVTANNGIQVAQARLREARASREIAQSLLYPQVDIGASVGRFRGSQAGIGVPVASNLEDNLFQVGFDATWQVDVFGGTRRLVESARANEQGADSLRRAAVLMVASETARAYLELRGAQRQLEVAKATLDDQRQTLAVTEDKNRNGLASTLEVVRARAEAEATASEIPPIEQAIRQYIHVLSALLALEPTALSDELMPTAPIPAAPAQVDAGVPSDLLRRRPDIQAAERHLASATAMVGATTAQLFPQMLLGGAGGLASTKTGDLFNGNTNNNSSSYYLTGTSINWTIFDAGRRKAAIKLSEAEVDAAKASYSDTVLGAFREVESSLVAVDRAQARVDDLKRLSASAREAVTIAQRDYRNGLLDQLTVLDAQRQSSRADKLLAQGQVALVVDVVTLYKAVGGGWEFAEKGNTR
jgi:NodT family efflux transporter outer membrane factor (OMF) lipoprotein